VTRTVRLRFDRGTLVIDADDLDFARQLDPGPPFVWDERVSRWRSSADAYRDVFAALTRRSRQGEFALVDEARTYREFSAPRRAVRHPRDYQTEALAAWSAQGRRGIVVLPTGAGKSLVAQLAIADAKRSALVVVPTLDLMAQWYDGLLAAFDVEEVGLMGGGSHDVRDLTVTTYDSFCIHAERIGDRFGLIVFDEVHHLPGPSYLAAAASMLAPFRLGLTATLERPDGRHLALDQAVGSVAYRREIKELAGDFLADYEVERVSVRLDDDERAAYDSARAEYVGFLKRSGVRLSDGGWTKFLQVASRTREGRAALRAYRDQRRIALTCHAKIDFVERLLHQHANDQVLLFTNDNATVYALSRRFLIPAITHQTAVRERREILQRFLAGTYRVVITSRVLNEGVDVPAANVAVVLSGSGSVREHVQRLGRILRKDGEKRALLYELIAEATVEEFVSERRRDHDAYR
jgi:superfamily II DNA or RNA helicase